MSKYNTKKVVIDKITFDSKVKGEYYKHLKGLMQQGVVKRFLLQPKFVLVEKFRNNGKAYHEIAYIADFEVLYSDGTVEVVDVKSFETVGFVIKKKLDIWTRR